MQPKFQPKKQSFPTLDQPKATSPTVSVPLPVNVRTQQKVSINALYPKYLDVGDSVIAYED
jgi:hypothetical protein